MLESPPYLPPSLRRALHTHAACHNHPNPASPRSPQANYPTTESDRPHSLSHAPHGRWPMRWRSPQRPRPRPSSLRPGCDPTCSRLPIARCLSLLGPPNSWHPNMAPTPGLALSLGTPKRGKEEGKDHDSSSVADWVGIAAHSFMHYWCWSLLSASSGPWDPTLADA